MGFFKNDYTKELMSILSAPTFGKSTDMYRTLRENLFPKFTSNKPSKKRAKVKAARKANLKNRKK